MLTPTLQEISQETLELAKQALGNPIQKDATTTGYTTATGLVGYELEAPAKSLYPVVTPFRNRIPRRKAPVGSTASNWRAITGINVGNARPTKPFGTAGDVIQVKEADFTAAYKLLALGNSVWRDAQTLARGFDDVNARASVDTLYALMIEEEKILLGGQNFALATPGAPTLTVSTTGGSIGAVNVGVKVAVRTGAGVHYGDSTAAGPEATTGLLSGSANSVTATVAAVRGAAQYDWYVGLAGGPWYFYTSTTVNKVTITSVPSSGTTAPTSDTSADANSFNGLLASLTGDCSGGTFVQYGAGTSTGVYYKSLDGATLTGDAGRIKEIDDALLALYQDRKLSPTVMILNPEQAVDITNKVVVSGAARLVLPVDAQQTRAGIIAGNYVTTYLNSAAGGLHIEILVDPYWPAGRIALLTERLPYPNARIENVFEVETQEEYNRYDYATSRQSGSGGGPRLDFEVRVIEVFKNYFPAGCALIDNIAKG